MFAENRPEPSYWAQIAGVAADCLAQIVETHRVNPRSFPRGILKDTQQLLRTASGYKQRLAEFPEHKVNLAAMDPMIVRIRAFLGPDSELTKLEAYTSLLGLFESERVLSPDEVSTAKDLHKFLLRIRHAGNAGRTRELKMLAFHPA